MEYLDHPSWLNSVISCAEGYETKAVEQFADRLIRLAQSRLPARLRRRVDPEDIVQSVFHSFFKRNREGRFQLENSSDMWRLLAAITYHKVMTAMEFHRRQRRDFSRELETGTATDQADSDQILRMESLRDQAASVSAIAVMTELLELILDQLPEVHQKILQLRLENYSIDEIAESVKVSSRTVDRALKRARTIAEDILIDDSDEKN